MNDDGRFTQLWNDYLEGEIDEQEIEEVRRLIESDPSHSKAAAESYQTHRLLGLLAQDSKSCHEAFVRATMAQLPAEKEQFVGNVMNQFRGSVHSAAAAPSDEPDANTIRGFVGGRSTKLLAIAVSVLLVLTGFLLFRSTGERTIARVKQLHGAVQWIGEGGNVEDLVESDRALGGGTLESLSTDSWVELEFDDGTAVTVSGRSMLTISEQQQKVLHLRYGDLAARVAPQPSDKPMLLHTPSAEMVVLGTQFNVDADASRTVLAVNEGRVSMQKLTGGARVEVPAEHQVIASLEEPSELRVTPRGGVVNAWLSDLTTDVAHGKRSSQLESLGAKLKQAINSGAVTQEAALAKYKAAVKFDEYQNTVWALPYAVRRKGMGKNADLVHVVSLFVSGRQSHQVILVPNSSFRVQGRITARADITFGINTDARDYGKAGKYSMTRTVEPSSGDGSFDIELPAIEFDLNTGKQGTPESPIGTELTGWWCTVRGAKVALEITHVELVE